MSAPSTVTSAIARRAPPRPPHLRIGRSFTRPFIPELNFFAVELVADGVRKCLARVRTRRAAQAVAARLCRELRVVARGRWSGFYRAIKREDFAERERLVAQRAVEKGSAS